jgi:N-acetylneuraminic acid mutarotase
MKVLAAIGIAMAALFVVGVLAAANVVEIPKGVKKTLGFEVNETPNPPCRIGLYTNNPKSPPAPPGQWQLGPWETPRNQVEASAISIGNTIYVVGGTRPGNLHRVVAFDTATGRFSEPAQLPIGLNHMQVAAHDGKLYVAGGYLDGEDPTNAFWEYDPQSDEWTKLPSLPRVTAAGATVALGDKLYVASGAAQTFGTSGPVPPYEDLQIYDFETGKWSLGPNVPEPRHHVSGAALDGRVYVAGGRGEADHSLTTFDRYDPATEEWETLADLPMGVASPGLVAVQDRLVIVGGEDQDNWEEGGGWVTPSAWEYDPRTDRWTRLPNMKFDRRGGGVAAVGNRVYAIGGSFCPGLKPNGPVGTYTVESIEIGPDGKAG